MSETQLIQLFADTAQRHAAIKWFDEGPADFLFNSERNIEYPALFVQSTGAAPGDNRVTYNYTVYCVDLPALPTETDPTAFEWDSNLSDSRGVTLTALTDVVSSVRFQNQQKFILTRDAIVPDNDSLPDGYVGYRVDISIDMDYVKDNANFPVNPAP